MIPNDVKVFKNDFSHQKNTPLEQKIFFKNHYYRVYETGESKNFLQNIVEKIKYIIAILFGTSYTISEPKKIKAIFINSPYLKDELVKDALDGKDIKSKLLKTDWNFLVEEIVSKHILKKDFESIPESLWKDKDFVLAAVSQDQQALQYVHKGLKKNKAVILAAKRSDHALNHQNLNKYKANVLKLVSKSGCALESVHEDWKKDREVVLAAVSQDGNALRYAHEDLRKDKEVVLAAISKNAYALNYAHEDLRKDKEVVLAATSKIGYQALEYAHEDLRKDKAFGLTIVSNNGDALQYLHEDLRKDIEVALTAISKSIYALQHAHKDLRKDKDFMLRVISIDSSVLPYIHPDLIRNKEFFMQLVSQDGDTIKYAHEDLRKDKEVVLAAVYQNGDAIKYAHEDLRKDKEVVLAAVSQSGYALEYAHEDLRKDREVVLAAVSQDGDALEYAHEDFKKDKAVVLAAIQQEPLAILSASGDVRLSLMPKAHQHLLDKLIALEEDPSQKEALTTYCTDIIDNFVELLLHEEHPLFQKAIEMRSVTESEENSPYDLYYSLQKTINEEPLLDEFVSFRQRAIIKSYTFADIPKGIIALPDLFASLEQMGVQDETVAALCEGKTLADVKQNVMGEGKLIPSLLAQKGQADDPLSITAFYLYAILEQIAKEDNIRKEGALSDRENRLLKFASMVVNCSTGQSDAIEQYYIYTINTQALGTGQQRIETTVDSTIQTAFMQTLASESLLKEMAGQDVGELSHQTLYLKNRYHKQIGLRHTLKFDRHAGVIDKRIMQQDPKEAIGIIKKHLREKEAVKAALDALLKAPKGYGDFISYFEKEFNAGKNFTSQEEYEKFIVFDEDLAPIAITPYATDRILGKLGYSL
jgi:hypothetical protein